MVASSATAVVVGVAGAVAAGYIVFRLQRRDQRRDAARDKFMRELDGVATGAEYSIANRDDEGSLANLQQYIGVARADLEAVRRTEKADTVAIAQRSLDAYAEALRALRAGEDDSARAALETANGERSSLKDRGFAQ